ncbi:acyltransferase family protein [Alisedimentitalea sp. MJ-SS2]|uniref:acyltransferase family protein n=1 Tax=Aliisedimentitalea sp. MJ-SS2 TaxID=3049795 RepID=UPI002907E886|nr:acyltransferase family protein [Alisedimentitalea sp. MJ-SS2]MDU8929422.1 acyltransferase family protein [Alisedimentitalea sp. MJ-SS2]
MARSYRRDIDGLRAIAILGVVIDHAGFTFLGGGFAGVDVFFVISGYLIGGHIFEDLAAGKFTFKRFYARRFRRIYPALVAVLLVTLIAGWFVMLPYDYRYMGGAAFTALLSLSNVWFLQTIDYFRPEAAHDPLVHTWSLGVEEQFYLIVPLLLVMLWRWRRGITGPFLVALISLSLGIAIFTSGEYRMEAFYLLHTRAWELFGGVLVAWLAFRGWNVPRPLRTPLSLLGLVLILAGLILMPHHTPWPGVWTLPTVVGTALILLAGRDGLPVSRLLAIPPMRFIGLISYSLYLWHQPVFSLLAQGGHWPDTLAGILLVLAALIGIAALSWRFVEQPFRRGAQLARPRKLVLAGVMTAIIAVALGGHISRGYPDRIPAQVAAVIAYDQSIAPSYRRCIYTREEVPALDLDTSCTFGVGAPPSVVIWGDSHAARISEPLGNALGEHGLGLRQLTLSSCQPAAGLINTGQTRAAQCPAFNDMVLNYLNAHPEITDVVMFATWNSFIFATSGPDMLGQDREDDFYSVPLGQPEPATRDARLAAFTDALANTLKALGDQRNITLVMALPRPDISIPRHFAKSLWRGTAVPDGAGFDRAYAEILATQARAVFADAIEQSGLPSGRIHLIDPYDALCDDQSCALIRDGVLLYSDGNHPTLEGVAEILPAIVSAVVD